MTTLFDMDTMSAVLLAAAVLLLIMIAYRSGRERGYSEGIQDARERSRRLRELREMKARQRNGDG